LYYFVIGKGAVKLHRIAMLCAASVVLPLLVTDLGSGADINGDLAKQAISLLYMRTYGMTGVLTGAYADFFSSHPYTLMSHAGPFAMFHTYPFAGSLGEVIGFDLTGADANANANFYATDGIAAFGYPGLILIGCIVGFGLRCIDAVAGLRSSELKCCAVIPVIMSLANTSFFTTVLTGGLGVMILIFYLWDAANRPATRQHPRAASQ
jgi:hypothetical protein